MCYLLRITLTILVVISLSSLSTMAAPPESAESTAGGELVSGYITVVDDKGVIVLQTGHEVHPGDEYISEDDVLYEITAVEGTLARCRAMEKISSHAPDNAIFVQAPSPDAPKPKIALYHSHTDESYIPNDGVPTERGNGSIMTVGDTFEKRLTELGYQVDHSKTLHDPHDANAYHRSRRTAMKLLQGQPVAIFDIHRDSAPLRTYSTTINGENVTKLLLVVGRQNQNRNTTLDFARNIKSATDAKYRGLIRGIFIARGNYNQDLSPRALLVEAGTEYNTREAAERSMALFADVVPSFLGPGGGNGGVAQASPAGTYTDTGGDNTGGGSDTPIDTAPGNDILGLALAVVVGAAAFLFLSTGSWQEAKRKLKHFFKYEFANFFGPRKKRKE
ncbi:stage II sporulation protein P [Sporomusa sp.]|uniref:stage II sporulation protein P n=1 Tax=Sporomusa sp. TaxID=2078658 RepID=UPI002D13AF86|nr:stage II sporulation protein P [Sporomusa sp.]HWR45322.1 stage II sporulation protein P [Sporomusa sp.]